jgi:hypothetical protein
MILFVDTSLLYRCYFSLQLNLSPLSSLAVALTMAANRALLEQLMGAVSEEKRRMGPSILAKDRALTCVASCDFGASRRAT